MIFNSRKLTVSRNQWRQRVDIYVIQIERAHCRSFSKLKFCCTNVENFSSTSQIYSFDGFQFMLLNKLRYESHKKRMVGASGLGISGKFYHIHSEKLLLFRSLVIMFWFSAFFYIYLWKLYLMFQWIKNCSFTSNI